jgi:hypothetical protein
MRARTRAATTEAHAVLARNLCGRPPIRDCFGSVGRAWLAALDLPAPSAGEDPLDALARYCP